MNVAVIVSTKDPAGMNIRSRLRELGFSETGESFDGHPLAALKTQHHTLALHTTDTDTIYCENIDQDVEADILAFASKHKSASKIPSLTVHATGNFATAQLGGRNATLCTAAEGCIMRCFQLLTQTAPQGFEVILEATHHGPYVQKPSFFIELGSDETGWADEDGARAVAQALVQCFSEPLPEQETAIAIGGPHHAPAFRKTLLSGTHAISHLCPKHALESLDEAMLRQMLSASMQPARAILLDRKGLGQHKERVTALARASGLHVAWARQNL